MPRYFKSLGAGRPITLGGRSFTFEPVEPMGGSWAGVLAVDEESAATILAGAGLEISEARYNELKKKTDGPEGKRLRAIADAATASPAAARGKCKSCGGPFRFQF